MRKFGLIFGICLLLTMLLAGCHVPGDTESPTTEANSAPETVTTTEMPTEAPTEASTEPTAEPVAQEQEETVYEGDASSYYIDEVYSEQIGRYAIALGERWGEGAYFEHDMSALPYYYYEGNPLDNVGFGFVDLDNDGSLELVIGAIMNGEQDPAVFEIWTLVDGEPVMLAQGGTRNRYVLEYVEEDEMWYVVNEGSSSAFCNATYYLMLNEGKLEVVQGIVFDASADEQNPWFMTYDLDWDVSNDEPIDEDTANAILESNRNYYTALEYIPYSDFILE